MDDKAVELIVLIVRLIFTLLEKGALR